MIVDVFCQLFSILFTFLACFTILLTFFGLVGPICSQQEAKLLELQSICAEYVLKFLAQSSICTKRTLNLWCKGRFLPNISMKVCFFQSGINTSIGTSTHLCLVAPHLLFCTKGRLFMPQHHHLNMHDQESGFAIFMLQDDKIS